MLQLKLPWGLGVEVMDFADNALGIGLGIKLTLEIKCFTLEDDEQKDESHAASSSISKAAKSSSSFCNHQRK